MSKWPDAINSKVMAMNIKQTSRDILKRMFRLTPISQNVFGEENRIVLWFTLKPELYALIITQNMKYSQYPREDLHWSLENIQELMGLTVTKLGRGIEIACVQVNEILPITKWSFIKD